MDKLTNLLPLARQRALTRAYLLRVFVIAFVLVIVLTLSGAVLLIPTYVYVSGNERSKQSQLADLEPAVAPGDAASLSTRLAALSNNTAALVELSKTLSISSVLRALLSVARPGITLSEFAYTPSADRRSGTLTVSGSSATRDALRDYQLALEGAPWARAAALPVSAYAKDADIAFTITVTLAP